MQKVYLARDHFLEKLGHAISRFGLSHWQGKRVAVKLHMGEYGNLNHVRPAIAGKIVEVLREAGAKPFLFDSVTLYKNRRHSVEDYFDTARRNGFTDETMGCPIVISNDSVPKQGRLFPVNVSKEVAEADAMLVLSHCKGHAFSGLGGAIKNLGMGAVDRETKKLCHDSANMVVNREKCIGCAACVPKCPVSAIKVKAGKAAIDYGLCWGCASCFKECRQNALSPKKAMPDAGLASCALSVLECFERQNLLFVNVLMDISRVCDCHGDASLGEVPGIGILVSDNILAIDNASIDLINKRFGSDFFEAIGYRDPKQQIRWLEQQGYGKADYQVVEV